jgi:very-short-patch-repair endonuclease
MTRSSEEIDEVLHRHRVIAARDHPSLRRTLQRRAHRGELLALLPGVFVRRQDAVDPEVRIRAALAWQPDAVLTGAAAAHLTYWPELVAVTVTMSLPRKVLAPSGFRVCEETLPPEEIATIGELRVTTPALTALDLVVTHGGEGIDEALRRRACSLDDLWSTLDRTPRRRGNPARRRALLDSRANPWSAAERRCHALLRSAGVTGWRGNVPVRCGSRSFVVDVCFAALKVAVEIDGYEFHSGRVPFERDRRKWSELTAHGWRIIHLTWQQLTAEPDWVLDVILATLAAARRDCRRASA